MVRVSSSYCNYEGSLAPSVFFFPLTFFLGFFFLSWEPLKSQRQTRPNMPPADGGFQETGSWNVTKGGSTEWGDKLVNSLALRSQKWVTCGGAGNWR